MDSNFENTLSLYDYSYPEELIASFPAEPRDSARLLVYSKKSGEIKESHFNNLPELLPPRSVLIFNETKVLPARLSLYKKSGGRVRVLIVSIDGGLIKVMADRKLSTGESLTLSGKSFRVSSQEEKYFFLAPPKEFTGASGVNLRDFYGFLEDVGDVPLPPYIKQTTLGRDELLKKYQTVFARIPGSVAAPTASLHFTENLIDRLRGAGHEILFITLHVGLGTFAPLTGENVARGLLHKEYYEISPETVAKIVAAKVAGRKVIAVGTTAVRAIESAADGAGEIVNPVGETELFIREGYDFKVVDALITNFHVPRSSLMMLVSALVGREKLLEIYNFAILRKFRLFSFGDGMLVY